MTAVALLAQLSGLGVAAWADGATLRFKPASLVPPDVLADLRAHKAEVMALLTAPIVPAMPSPSAAILGLFPADRGYLARQPVQAAPAIATNPDVAEGHIAALAAAVAAQGGAGEALPLPHWPPGHWRPRRYTSDLTDQLWTTMARPISWADPAARPEEGSYCGNCEYRHWARDTRGADGGWACSICHPADNVPVEHRDVVRWVLPSG